MRRYTDRLRDTAAIAILFLFVLAFTWRIGLAGRVLAGGDVFTYFYPYWAEATRAVRAGRLPLWNPTLFMGVPFAANSQVGFFYPLNWPLWLLLPAHRSVHVTIVLHLCLAALNAYLWGRKALCLGRIASWTVAVVFALGGYIGAQVEHINQLQGLAWLPLALLLAHRITFPGGDAGRHDGTAAGIAIGVASVRKRLGVSCLLAVVIGAVLLAGHTQTAFISLFGVAVYAAVGSIVQSVRAGSWRPSVRVALLLSVAVGLGVALAAVQLFPTWGLSRLSVRAQGLPFNERVSFSLSPAYAGRALLPDLGGSVPPDHLEHVAYVGTIGLALALVGGMTNRGRRQEEESRTVWARRLEYPLILLGLFFALGLYNPVYLFLARFVPGFAHFRVPARWLALYSIGVAGLTGRAVEALWARRAPDSRRVLIVAGLLMLLILWAVLGARLGAGGDLLVLSVFGWAAGGGAAIGLLLAARRRPRAATLGLLMVLTTELFLASGALPQARATAPQAFTSLRPAVTHLLASGRDGAGPRDRFLSMSDTTFDPGDLPLIRIIYGPQLSDDQLYDYVIATKQKEILSPNLPLAFDVPAVDGYGGGLLPLARYVTLQRAFLSAEEVSIDGRLRENLTAVPEGRWLSLFNVRYVITDKLQDAWIDDVFYDLQFHTRLSRGDTAGVAEVPVFEATALGVVSHLGPGTALPDGAPVGVVRVGFADGDLRTFELRAGEDVTGDAGGQNVGAAATRLRWPESKNPISVTVEAVLPAGEWIVRGASLIDERTGSFQSLVLSEQGRYRLVHSGDVKIYENLDVLPRAFIVPEARVVNSDEAALEAVTDPKLDLSSRAVLQGEGGSCGLEDVTSAAESGDGGVGSHSARAAITSYRPEQVVVEAVLERRGYLLLTDTHYPGWQATVDGAPASICRADLLFRAVPLGPGEHRVVFTFRPPLQRVGMWVTLAGLVGLLLVWHERRIVETISRCYNRMQA